jgi:hypothetical protein
MTQPVDAPSTAAGPPPAAKSFLSRVTGTFFAPDETLADVARKPDLVAILILLVLTWIPASVMIAMRVDFGAQIRAEMESRGGMSAEQMEQAMRIGSAFSKAVAFFAPLFSLIMLVIVTAIFFFVFRLFGGEGKFGQALSITAYSWLPLSLGSVLSAIVLATRTGVTPQDLATLLKSNPAFLVDLATQPVLFGLLSSIDVFVIWSLALLSIGFAHMSRFSKAKSATIVFSLWFTWILVKTGGAAIMAGMKKG